MSNINQDEKIAVRDWIVAHNADYASVRDRLEHVRNVLLNGRIDSAADMLRKAYVFSVMSIQTQKDRHEGAFIAHYRGGMDLKEACLETVYGGQKYGWISRTFDSNDFENLVLAIRYQHDNGSRADLLDVIVNNLTGVSHRKGSFMLAMCGMYEFMCIDSNVGSFTNYDGNYEFYSSEKYIEACDKIYADMDVPRQLPPFIVQWAIYDYERGEHARHMVYFNEVLS